MPAKSGFYREPIKMCKRHSKLDVVLSFILAGAVLAGAGFILYSTQADCEARLAPAHRMCSD